MRIEFFRHAAVLLFIVSFVPAPAQASEIEELRAELELLRAEYGSRIAELERRLEMAEDGAQEETYAARQPEATQQRSYTTGDSAFNPAIGVVFQGFMNANEGEPGEEEGFAVGETELIMNANVDDKFAAYLTAALAFEDGESELEIEEAWVESTALPVGLGARFGRMFSGIGYLNSKHSHTWDFADQPLPYQAFLDGRYVDNGVRLSWLAPTDIFVELSGELMQGEGDPSGLGAHTLFANVGGDVGADHSWLAGLSRLEQDVGLDLTMAHLVWKWAPNGNWKQRNLVFQAEYFDSNDVGADEGWYAQAVYQPIPRWRFGGRFDAINAAAGDNPKRQSLMVDWSNSEFSRLRLQFTNDQTGAEDLNEWTLQYIHSIGAHGAHTF